MSDSGTPSSNNAGSANAGRSGSKRSGSTIADLELAFAQNSKGGSLEPLCEAYMEAGRYMEAMVTCKKGLKNDPSSISAQILLGRIYAAQKKYSRALKHLNGVLAQNSSSTSLLFARAEILEQSGDSAGAIEDYKSVLTLEPVNQKAIEALAKHGIQTAPPAPVMPPHMNTGAVPSLPRGASGLPVPEPASGIPNPITPGIRHSSITPLPAGMDGYSSIPAMGRQKLEGEDELEAMASQVAETAPTRGNPALSVALVFTCLIVVGAIVAYRFYEKNKTEAIAELTVKARASVKQDTFRGYQNAAKVFERIIQEHDEAHPLTLGRLARVYAILWGEHGDSARLPELEQILVQAKKYAPEVSYTKSAEALKLLYDNSDRVKGAIAAYDVLRPYLKKVSEKGGEASVAEMTLGLTELERGNYERAVKKLSDVSKNLPSNVRAKVLSARAYFRAGRLSKAEFNYSKALKMAGGSDHPSARVERALVRLQRGELLASDEDIKAFREYLRKYPKDVSEQDRALAEYARSEVLRAAGHDAEAEIAYRNAVEKDPNNADFPYGKGRWLLKVGRASKAITPLEQALKLGPNRSSFLIALAEAEIETGKFGEASERLESVLQVNAKNIDALVVKGKLLSKQKKPAGEKFHADFVESSGGHVRALIQQAAYFRAMSQDKKALASLEKAIESMTRYSSSIQAQVLLAYGRLKEIVGEDLVAVKCFKKAAEFGELEGWYEIIRVQRQAGASGVRDVKLACQKYLAAGTAQIHHSEVMVMCGLRPAPEEEGEDDVEVE